MTKGSPTAALSTIIVILTPRVRVVSVARATRLASRAFGLVPASSTSRTAKGPAGPTQGTIPTSALLVAGQEASRAARTSCVASVGRVPASLSLGPTEAALREATEVGLLPTTVH